MTEEEQICLNELTFQLDLEFADHLTLLFCRENWQRNGPNVNARLFFLIKAVLLWRSRRSFFLFPSQFFIPVALAVAIA